MSNPDYAPLNDNFDKNPDKDYIVGPYSTFDQKLSDLTRAMFFYWDKSRKQKSPVKRCVFNLIYLFIRNKMANYAIGMTSEQKMIKHGGKIADIFINVLAQPEISRHFYDFDSLNARNRVKLANVIVKKTIDEMNRQNIDMPYIPVNRANSTIKDYFAVASCKTDRTHIKLCAHIKRDLMSFMVDIFHELIHSIDMARPNNGPLGAQMVESLIELDFGNKTHMDIMEINAELFTPYIEQGVLLIFAHGQSFPKQTEYLTYLPRNIRLGR